MTSILRQSYWADLTTKTSKTNIFDTIKIDLVGGHFEDKLSKWRTNWGKFSNKRTICQIGEYGGQIVSCLVSWQRLDAVLHQKEARFSSNGKQNKTTTSKQQGRPGQSRTPHCQSEHYLLLPASYKIVSFEKL